MSINIYERHEFDCECGHHHAMPIGEVVIKQEASKELPNMIKKLGLGKKGLLVTDEVIFNAMGKDILDEWCTQGVLIETFVLKGHVHPDESTVGEVICNTPFDTDFVVSIGGGTVTDIVRYVTTRLGLPCVSIPSAMTMDGFFTNMSIIIIGGLQVTYYLDYPTLILADTAIIAKAPNIMNAAGVGEIISKISAAMDWYAAKQIKAIYYCDAVEDMMGQCIAEGASRETIEGVAAGNLKSIEMLTDSLYKSAVGMAWYNSSPCGSGAEHQLNHFWVKCQDEKGVPQPMHGQEVGVGAVVNMMVWEEIMKVDFDHFDIEDALCKMWSYEVFEKEIRRVYKDGAEKILELQSDNHSFDKEKRRTEIQQIIKVRKSLLQKLRTLPSAQGLAERLKKAGGPYKPQQVDITKEELRDSLYYAKEMRSGRYNALWIAEALGMLEEIAAKIIREFAF